MARRSSQGVIVSWWCRVRGPGAASGPALKKQPAVLCTRLIERQADDQRKAWRVVVMSHSSETLVDAVLL